MNQEAYLRVFLEDGDVPIDNNALERAIRGFCIGKKNWQMNMLVRGNYIPGNDGRVYYRSKMAGGIYEDGLHVKPVKSAVLHMPDET